MPSGQGVNSRGYHPWETYGIFISTGIYQLYFSFPTYCIPRAMMYTSLHHNERNRMEDHKKDLIISAKLGHRLFDITTRETTSVGHGLLAGIFNVCLLAKSSPIEITEEQLVMMLRDAYGLVSDAAIDDATSREAAKYGIQ